MHDTVTDAQRPASDASASPSTSSKTLLFGGTAAVVLALDILTKWIVERTMRPYDPIPVWGDFFRLTYIFNRGAAFGLHLGDYSRWIFGVLAIIAVLVLFGMYRATPPADRVRIFALALVSAGAIGNLIDRVRSDRGVVDFLDFGFGTGADAIRWPVFNVADIGVTIGALLLAFSLWKEEQQPERDAGR